MLEVVLALLMLVLIIVLLLETREYNKAIKTNRNIDILVDNYTRLFNSLLESTQSVQGNQTLMAITQRDIINNLVCMKAVLDIHNRALLLSPDLVSTIPGIATNVETPNA